MTQPVQPIKPALPRSSPRDAIWGARCENTVRYCCLATVTNNHDAHQPSYCSVPFGNSPTLVHVINENATMKAHEGISKNTRFPWRGVCAKLSQPWQPRVDFKSIDSAPQTLEANHTTNQSTTNKKIDNIVILLRKGSL